MKSRFVGIVATALFSLTVANGQGTISTVASASTLFSGLAIDGQGNLYFTDASTARVKKLTPGGTLTTIAGNGTFAYSGDGGQATSAALNLNASGVSGIALDGSGNIYFADSANQVIRKINASTGVISTFAGNGTGAGTGFGGFSGDGGAATSAMLGNPTDIAFDSNGNLYICDSDNNRIRKVTPGGVISTFAGNGNAAFSGDGGQATAAAVPSPAGITADSQGNVYIAGSRRVRRVAPNGVISTYAGTGTAGFSGDGGLATAATLRAPFGLAVDQFGNLYLSDNSNGRVRKVDAAGIITTYAGIDGNNSTPLGDGGPATSAYLGTMGDLVLGSDGTLYVSTAAADHRIRKILAAGAGFVSTPPSLTFSYTIGGANPASQNLSITSTGGVLSYTTSASSTGNWLSASPGNGSTPGALTVSVNPAGLAGGTTYQGTVLLTPSGSGNSPLSINVSLTVTGVGAPTIDAGGVVNVSGYQPKLSPGVVFVVFGHNLGPAALVQNPNASYPTSLAGTSLSFTPTVGSGPSFAAKIVYTFAGAVAAVLPSSITPGTYAVRDTYNSLTSAPENVTVVARSFGIAAANSGGTGLAQATIATINGGLTLTRFTSGAFSASGLDWQLSPAHPGDIIVLWGTGGGADLLNDTGGSSGDQKTAGAFAVTISGRGLLPEYAGAVAGYPGLWQINVKLPLDIAVDCFSTVQVTAGGETGNKVILPIAAVGQNACTSSAVPPAVLSKMDANGTINVATFAIAKVTETVSSTIQETASGSVQSFTAAEWAILNSGPVFGLCRVNDRTFAQGGRDPGAADSTLDAGAKLNLSGPNLPAGSGMLSTTTALGPVYVASMNSGTFAAGTYPMSGTGGTQVGAFNTSVAFPTSFTATNFAGIASVDRSQPLTFNWTSTGVSLVQIVVNSVVVANGTQHLATINCTVPASAGTYSVPTGALAYLSPATNSGGTFGSISIQGQNAATFTAPLTVGGQTDIGIYGANLGVGKNIPVQ